MALELRLKDRKIAMLSAEVEQLREARVPESEAVDAPVLET